jgi:hypothetical protein
VDGKAPFTTSLLNSLSHHSPPQAILASPEGLARLWKQSFRVVTSQARRMIFIYNFLCVGQAADDCDTRKFNGEESFISFADPAPQDWSENSKL